MPQQVLVLIGTRKGAFIVESDAGRNTWQIRGPFCEACPMNHVIAYPATGVYDISRARAELGYKPEFDLERGIADYLAALKQMKAAA